MSCKGCSSQAATGEITTETQRHPCYSAEAHHRYARMHLPIAPKCNISCNYCNRKYDCVNESRPGVTSEVLTPEGAQAKYELVKTKVPNLSVVGVAGPGDALANWEQTKRALSLIRGTDAEVTFCLSTNGLMLPMYAQEIVDLGVKHVTVTVNSIDPEIGAQIYNFVTYEGKTYTGVKGAELLLCNQLAGIEYLVRRGVLVKVNIVMIPGINATHIPAVVQKMRDLSVFITNIMPLIPAPGSAFADFPQTSQKDLAKLRERCQVDMRQMFHCQQCRADAIGLLGEDRSPEFRAPQSPTLPDQCDEVAEQKYTIAVTSKQGIMVDQHFGHAKQFRIYSGNGHMFTLVEVRDVTQYCVGVEGCEESDHNKDKVLVALRDCAAVLTLRIGYEAKRRLFNNDILVIESCDSIPNGLLQASKLIS
ncbi:MAG: nitrogenase cofactor biosynthesis protein NifB [Peptococcaceae bacterium]|nr:nitrogenase cofactor biosynthesis protein NifB [Peptococcaceae bacterium]